MKKEYKIGIGIGIVLFTMVLVRAAIPDTVNFKIENSTGTVFTVDKYGNVNATGHFETDLDLYVGGTIFAGDDKLKEAIIDFDTVCAAGSHLYVSGNDLACEADDYAADTNATTECAADEYLEGGGSCIGVTNCAAGSFLRYTTADNTWHCEADTDTSYADTNASTACANDQYLDGGGSCVSIVDCDSPNFLRYDTGTDTWSCAAPTGISDVYVNETGDTMTGNLIMSDDADIQLNATDGRIMNNQTSAYFYFDANGGLVVHLEA